MGQLLTNLRLPQAFRSTLHFLRGYRRYHFGLRIQPGDILNSI